MNPAPSSEPPSGVAPATERYELVIDHQAAPGPGPGLAAWLARWRARFPFGRRGGGIDEPGVRIFSIRDHVADREVFHHIEDWDGPDADGHSHGHDEPHLYDVIADDLATMTVDEFAARWRL